MNSIQKLAQEFEKVAELFADEPTLPSYTEDADQIKQWIEESHHKVTQDSYGKKRQEMGEALKLLSIHASFFAFKDGNRDFKPIVIKCEEIKDIMEDMERKNKFVKFF